MFQSITDEQVLAKVLQADQSCVSRYANELLLALRRYSQNPGSIPRRIIRGLETQELESSHIFMPVIDSIYTGIKTLGNDIKSRSSSGFLGSVSVLDPRTGKLEAIFEAKHLTAIRTAIVSNIPLRELNLIENRPTIKLSVIGTGLQAFWHIMIFTKMFGGLRFQLLEIAVFYRSSEFSDDLKTSLEGSAKHMRINMTINYYPINEENISKIIGTSDVIFGCVPTTEPYMGLSDFECHGKHTYISVIGSYKPEMHECRGDLIQEFKNQNAKIIVDSKEHTLSEAGELIDNGIRDENLIEIGEMDSKVNITISHKNHKITLCKLVGLAIMDIAIARVIAQESNQDIH